ncbi:hypothetical protein [Salinarimonas soli]|uniref:Uncharacterized protein n=1 Tax=Salinarimonas soli TaxID=1638099 RepID=A0A5B2VD28_9HYPH|nr:hypothetical protein [Salinarimonas soli]KAA2236894.1 hypothetical protein F0L46_12960 [Salinarimonas soli]
MNFFSRISGWLGRGSDAQGGSHGKTDLQKNMEKALEMKKAAGPQTHIPEHVSAHDGNEGSHATENDNVGRQQQQGAFEPQLKRTHGNRQGDLG